MPLARKLRPFVLGLLAAALPLAASAWWNKDWTQRTRIVLNTSAQGVTTQETVAALPLAVRLHSGNFDFLSAKEDGSDLRFVAGDDKTPLSFRIERWDPVNELAVVWVQVPQVLPGSDKNMLYAYAGHSAAPAAADSGTGFDAATLAAIHFDGRDNAGSSHDGRWKAADAITPEANALLGGGARLAGQPLVWPAQPALRIAAGGATTLSLWLRSDEVARGTLLAWGPISLTLEGGQLAARVGGTRLAGGEVAPTAWTQVALTVGNGQAQLYVNGAAVAKADVATPLIEGELRVGEGLRGVVDEVQVSSVARSPAWLQLAAASQSAEARLLATTKDSGEAAEGQSHGYIGILVSNLTLDAWVVIGILGVMFVVAAWVMVTKAVMVGRDDKANHGFLERFRGATHDLLLLDQAAAAHAQSPLFRLYQAGVRELAKRQVGVAGAPPLSGASLDAVKAAVDADLVRESHRLNAQMVLLTIAISGGPFLGLLGTVVGVMITFAAIAAAGDVNVNAIAPGIAAALLATVAGLGVAIPALFGYNYLAARIKNISADMQIFVDEFITRVAELYGAR
ncbi:DUF2341 domain-containing protein [Aquincola tertiaricarbonis]|uniref:DUF2341 domain-containing protein n=1 Tax=Aquincola tertiaricarbonis TaxID=391953 RepID=A0ABY4S1P4_AQUTE|nr:DUF2341 domain-containing protein [Aquincola tertiaricarbonis]URI06520.1 DUF2341 domain-containing protein [Aquincola tertiaricarbonis]